MSSGKTHSYPIRMRWIGNTGQGTRQYRGYERAHEYSVEGKPIIPGSSDPNFRGDRTRYNPEELLVMKLIAHRSKDQIDASGLARLEGLDWPYVERWAAEWDVTDRLRALRSK